MNENTQGSVGAGADLQGAENPFLVPIKIVEPADKLPDFTIEQVQEPMRATMLSLGWADLMPVQRKAIPYMMAGRDMLIQSKTGSGKTGAFVIPLLHIIERTHLHPQALILVPTRELALQVHEEIVKLGKDTGVRSVAIFGGVGYESQIRALREGVHIIVATPGRLLDHLQRGNVVFRSCRDLIMDEADEMLSMGFYPDMQRIQGYLPRDRATTMFSATIPPTVRALAREFQRKGADFLSLSYDQVAAQNLEHRYYLCESMEKDSMIIKLLEWENPESCIIFCNMKKDVHYLEQLLNNNGFHAGGLSGDIQQKQRERILKQFRDKQLNILIATDVAARGIDISHVSHVLLHDHPDDHEVYVHRSGRTARAGRSGVAISLVTPVEEIDLLRTAADFGIEFIKMPHFDDEALAARMRQRAVAALEREKRNIGQRASARIKRYIPLVEQLSSFEDERELLAWLIDRYYTETASRGKEVDEEETDNSTP